MNIKGYTVPQVLPKGYISNYTPDLLYFLLLVKNNKKIIDNMPMKGFTIYQVPPKEYNTDLTFMIKVSRSFSYY